jgi:hypothetical protein
MNATCSTKTIVRFQKRAQWGDATGFAWRCDAAGVTTINPCLIEWIERVVHFCGREKKPQQKTSSPMRFLLATSILASILISSSIAAKAGPMETAPPPAAAPTIVHVQPRARDFNPYSAANRPNKKGFRDSMRGRGRWTKRWMTI